jgi:hypothetical protein
VTEAEWLSCANARTLLTFLGEKPGERKLRLFTCACWRQRWPEPTDPRSAWAVAAAERYADGLCSWAEVKAADEEASLCLRAAGQALDEAGWGTDRAAFRAAQDRHRAASAAEWATAGGHIFAAEHVLRLAQEGATKKQRAGFADLVREVFGNPFRAAPVDPAWLTANGGLVRRLTQSIYDERRFGDLGVLADALEDAGCTDADLLGHLRSEGPHVRGCWAVDLLLGRE